jgi:hypothetical protein
MAVGKSELDQDILALDVTEPPKLSPEGVYVDAARRALSEEANPPNPRRLFCD